MSELAYAAELVASAQTYLRYGEPAQLADAVTRSHLSDGRTLGWTGPVPRDWAWVIDAEYAAGAPPAALAERFGADNFWQRWTQAECACKLAGIPIATWWSRHGLGMPVGTAAVWRTLTIWGVVVTVAGAPINATSVAVIKGH